ncbi:DNA-directed RNA polymerase I subunit rpa49, partial [Cladochytrium tenue]
MLPAAFLASFPDDCAAAVVGTASAAGAPPPDYAVFAPKLALRAAATTASATASTAAVLPAAAAAKSHAAALLRDAVVVAETGIVELTASPTPPDLCPVKYVVALRDKGSGRLRVVSPAQPLRFSTVVKRQKKFTASKVGEKNTLARNTLGEAFGTVKRKQAIRALQRNKVTASSVDAVKSVISKTVDEASAAIPTADAMAIENDKNRPIPPFNLAATKPSEVYNIQDILPDSLASLLVVDQLWECKFEDELKQLLGPLDVSSWVFERIFHLVQSQNKDVLRVQR